MLNVCKIRAGGESGKEIKDMTKKKKFKKVLIIIVVLSPLWLWLWFHPIQKSLAEMRFESYIAEQNVPEDDIKTKEVMRDAKRDVVYPPLEDHRPPN